MLRLDLRLATLAAFCSFACLASPSALAITAVTPTDLQGLGNDAVSDLIETVGIAADHRAYAPATALGLLLGIDVGVDATYFSLPTDFANALASASGQTTSTLPSGLLLPKLNIHKGLPFGIDIGATFMTLSSGGNKLFSSYAGEIKYAFINSAALPAVAVRASYSVNSVYFLDANTFTLDALVSKNLILIDPYLGAGIQRWSGKINIPAGIPTLQSGISNEASGTAFHVYGGVQLKLAILKLVGEAAYSTAGMTTFGTKVSIGF
jgi:hypothetical protein